ncbi:MAG: DsbA family protein [Thermoleophilaceae bacterium]
MTDTQLNSARRRRLMWIVGGAVVVIAAVAVVIAVSSGGGGGKAKSPAPGAGSTAAAGASGVKGASLVAAEFKGIPQSGNTLGSPTAKATMMVFADLQCPFCAEFENNALPTIVDRYVRPGKLKLVFQPIVIIGNDSVLGARAAAAAAQQQKLFQFVGIAYHNQGHENSGYMNEAFVKKIAAGVPGLNVAKLVGDLKAAPVNKLLNDAQAVATSGHVSSTPTFFVAKTGQTLQQLSGGQLTPADFTGPLDKLTR